MKSNLQSQEIREVWFFLSELTGQRASSFRQGRWCQVFLSKKIPVRAFNTEGMFGLTQVRFSDEQGLKEFRENALKTARAQASVREGAVSRFLRKVKHTFMMDLYYPNVFRLIWEGLKEARKTPNKILLMASSPPFSVTIAAYVVKMIYGDKIIFAVDMRDAWALHTGLGGNKFIKKVVEKFILRRADYVITVSKGLQEEFDENYGTNVVVLYNIATHYFEPATKSPINWAEIHPDISENSIKLVYTGSTPVGFYDLESLVAGVKQFVHNWPELKNKVQLLFVGACDEVRTEVNAQGGVGTSIVNIAHVPHLKAKLMQQHADGLIFLGYFGANNKGVVSTKFFEYLVLGQPIYPFHVYDKGDVGTLLQNFCGGNIHLFTAAEIEKSLVNIANKGASVLPKLQKADQLQDLFNSYHHFIDPFVGKEL